MADEQDNGAPRADDGIPAAAPQPGGGAAIIAEDISEDPGLSGWLVMWGPLLIVGFLILVFMGHEREPALPTAVVDAPSSEPETSTASVTPPAPTETASTEAPAPSATAASELSAAFKAAGIAPPPVESTQPAPMALPKDLQGSPWAPSEGTAAAAPPPPPGYAQMPYGYPPVAAPGYAPMPYGYPPAGYGQYGQMAPGYGQMMPGYGRPMGPGYGRGRGYHHGQMMAPGYGQVPPGYGAPQAAQPGAVAPPQPPANAAQQPSQ